MIDFYCQINRCHSLLIIINFNIHCSFIIVIQNFIRVNFYSIIIMENGLLKILVFISSVALVFFLFSLNNDILVILFFLLGLLMGLLLLIRLGFGGDIFPSRTWIVVTRLLGVTRLLTHFIKICVVHHWKCFHHLRILKELCHHLRIRLHHLQFLEKCWVLAIGCSFRIT